MDETTNEAPAPEVPVRMATKGLGWSGRETTDEPEGELLREDPPDGAGGALTTAPLKPPPRKPAPPSLRPGMAKPDVERLGEAPLEAGFPLAGLNHPLPAIPHHLATHTPQH